jgi:hypothetical protein
MNINRPITLQINLSPGDVDYANFTVPALINHHPEAEEIILVIDLCKPQRTKLVKPSIRFPEPQYSRNKIKIVEIAKTIASKHSNCNIYCLESNDSIIKKLGDKYLGGWYFNTHDYGGCANMSYWLGFELPKNDLIIHYDGDIILYQKPNFAWTKQAIKLMYENKDVVASCPRFNTPFENSNIFPSNNHGVPFEKRNNCFVDNWFSTRCLLIDRKRFEEYLPFMSGRILVETLAVKYLNRGFPRSPEIILHRKIGGNNGKRLILDSFDSWMMHPHSKPVEFINNIEKIMNYVHRGQYPADQSKDDFELDKWLNMINNDF